MVQNIVQLIESNTDLNSMPKQSPSFAQFLYSDSNNVGFSEAKRKLELYANYYNRGVIPNYLACVERAGGAQNIRNRWDRTNSSGQMLNSSGINRNTIVPPFESPVVRSLVNESRTQNLGQTVVPYIVNQERTQSIGSKVVPAMLGSSHLVSSNQEPAFFRSQTFAPKSRSRIETTNVAERIP